MDVNEHNHKQPQTIANMVLGNEIISSRSWDRGSILKPTCIGTAISVATKAKMPRKAELVATATADLPLFASTM